MLVTDVEMQTLPTESEKAFISLTKLLNNRLDTTKGADEWRRCAHEYVQLVLAFVDERQLPLQVDRSYPRVDEAFYDWFADFQNAVTYLQSRFRFRAASGVPLGVSTVKLNWQYREQIHDLLNRVRRVVGSLQISEAKREAIFARISALELEVDKDRTRLDAVMDLILEGSATLGEAAENLEPAVKLLERLKGIFAQAKVESDPPALPSPEGEGVIKRLTGPAVRESEIGPDDIDGEIPF